MKKDSEIINKVLKGNRNAFEELVKRYQNQTFGFCYKILKDEQDAQEAAHLAFVKAYQKLDRFRKESSFSTWLFRIAYNVCLDQLRYNKKFYKTEDDNIMEWDQGEINAGVEYLTEEERSKYVKLAMNSLNPEECAIISSYYIDELSIRQISEITGLNESNVKIRLYRARKKMYTVLEKHLKNEVRSLIR